MESSPGLNIAALSRRTGVAPDTLRKWEQRYGILRPRRTAGGQRRYDEHDVARVEWLRDRLRDGYRIGEAARLLGGADGGEGAARTPAELRDAVLDAASRSDAEAVGRLLDQAFASGPAERMLAEVVAPLLQRVGDEWERGRFTVAQEHLVSSAVRARLDLLLADARGSVRGVAVLACAPGERHELGLLMLAVLMRADGWQVAHLGADTPVADALGFAEQTGARVLCLSAAVPERLDDLARELDGTPRPAGLAVVLGGAGASERAAKRLGLRYVNGDAAQSVTRLRELVE